MKLKSKLHIIISKVFKAFSNNNEWFDILNKDGNKIGETTRKIAHSDNSILHAVVHLHIINDKGQILLQKRASNKKIQPNKWDTGVGGHVDAGEDIETALIRETEEELGFTPSGYKYITKYIMKNEIESEYVHTYIQKKNKGFTFDPQEISEIAFFDIKKIEMKFLSGNFTPNFIDEFKKLKKDFLSFV